MSGRSLYRESVVFTARTTGAYGRIDGASTTLMANVQPGFENIVNAMGQEVTASVAMLLEASADGLVAVGDKAAWNGNTYKLLAVNPIRIRGQTDHVEVYGGPEGVSG